MPVALPHTRLPWGGRLAFPIHLEHAGMITNDAPQTGIEAAPPPSPENTSPLPPEHHAAEAVPEPMASQPAAPEPVASEPEAVAQPAEASAEAPAPAAPAVPEVPMQFDLGRIAQDLQIRKVQVDSVVH